MLNKGAGFRFIPVVLMAAAMLMLPGCRKVFDHGSYVKALLDAAYKAQFSEYMVLTESTEDEVQGRYDENMDFFVDEICTALEVNISADRRDKIRGIIERLLNGTSYEVVGAERVSSECYNVEVKIWAVTNFKSIEQQASGFADEFIEKLEGSDMKSLTPEEVNELYIDGLIDIMNAGVQTISYAEEKTIYVPVEYIHDKKRWYIPPEEQGKIFDSLIELK